MIDPSIITRGAEMAQLQQRQNMDALADLGGNLGQLVLGRRINQMQQLKTPEEQQAFAKKSIFAPQLNQQLKADQAAALKAANDQLKFNAELAKTGAETEEISSEAFKNNAQGQGYGLDNSGKKLGAIQGAFQQAALTGDKAQVLLGMNALVRTGMMTPEDYQNQAAIVNAMTPDELRQYAKGIALTDKDIAPYLYQTQNNAADNTQSDINNQRTTNASIYSTDVAAETANKNRAQQQEQFEQEISIEKAKAEFEQGKGQVQIFGGKPYMIYPNGDAIPISGPAGQSISAAKPETKVEKLQRAEKTQNFATAARSASEGATLAATLANDLSGLNAAAGGFGLAARVPGSPAHTFANKLETLRSNVFLAQIENMKGMGALTDAEGARLEKSIASLDISLSPVELQKNLTYIAQTLGRAAKTTSSKAQLYSGQNQPQGAALQSSGNNSALESLLLKYTTE
ncbi:MAG TPA: hypothetical protein DCD99_11410 [Acinetobacter schindleri]|nr:hypothetical protein [Acinetobacter schindleri]